MNILKLKTRTCNEVVLVNFDHVSHVWDSEGGSEIYFHNSIGKEQENLSVRQTPEEIYELFRLKDVKLWIST